jgi:inhibitor of cysteine peptidase
MIHRSLNVAAEMFLILFFVTGCLISSDSEIKTAHGTVKYISIEGGFYGIITDDGEHLDPVNLTEEYKVDGKKIRLDYSLTEEQVSFHMWGKLIVIKSIMSID